MLTRFKRVVHDVQPLCGLECFCKFKESHGAFLSYWVKNTKEQIISQKYTLEKLCYSKPLAEHVLLSLKPSNAYHFIFLYQIPEQSTARFTDIFIRELSTSRTGGITLTWSLGQYCK